MERNDPNEVLTEFGVVALQIPRPGRSSWGWEFESAARNAAWAGGRLGLFWPAHDGDELTLGFWTPTATTWRPSTRVADELGASTIFEQWLPSFTEALPRTASQEAWTALTESALNLFRERVGAFPWPGGRCAECGVEQPPHLPKCPYAL